MPGNTVLVLTHPFDPTADLVVEALYARDIPVFRCDPGQFPQQLEVGVEFDNGWAGSLRLGSRTLRLEDIGCAYYRRPTGFAVDSHMSEPEQQWARIEARAGFGGLLTALPYWLNHPTFIAAAEYKPLQLKVAAAMRLQTPRSLLTNDPVRARAFLREVGQVIYKPLGPNGIAEADTYQVIYATPLDGQLDELDGSIRRSAHFFQAWVDKAYEVRVTVVDETGLRRAYRCRLGGQLPGLAGRLRPTQVHAHRGAAGDLHGATWVLAAVQPSLRRCRLRRHAGGRVGVSGMQPQRAVGLARVRHRTADRCDHRGGTREGLSTVSTAPALRRQLVDQLVAAGVLRNAGWRDAFLSVPRELFLPRFFRFDQAKGAFTAVDRTDEDWLTLVYRDDAWTTQLDGDDQLWDEAQRKGQVQGVPTASSSAPSIMAQMLDALDIQDGQRVLELGTGTGYNAALLCHRLGDQAVTSVDVDAGLVDAAGVRLRELGYVPTLAAVDGDRGFPANAPYDRLLCTYAIPQVPPAWLQQLRPGGQLLTHLHRGISASLLIRLTVDDSGNASGRFVGGEGCFMASRNLPTADAFERFKKTGGQDGRLKSDSGLRLDSREPHLALIALWLDDVSSLDFTPDGEERQEWLLAADGSWACHYTESETVEQYGDRRLWDEAVAIRDEWISNGRRELTAYRMRVLADGGWWVGLG